MKLNKETFFKTELGVNLKECITAWNKALNTTSCCSGCATFTDEYRLARQTESWCQAQWEVYRLLLKQFYNVEYFFSRDKNFCGIISKDRTDVLFMVERSDR